MEICIYKKKHKIIKKYLVVVDVECFLKCLFMLDVFPEVFMGLKQVLHFTSLSLILTKYCQISVLVGGILSNLMTQDK